MPFGSYQYLAVRYRIGQTKTGKNPFASDAGAYALLNPIIWLIHANGSCSL